MLNWIVWLVSVSLMVTWQSPWQWYGNSIILFHWYKNVIDSISREILVKHFIKTKKHSQKIYLDALFTLYAGGGKFILCVY